MTEYNEIPALIHNLPFADDDREQIWYKVRRPEEIRMICEKHELDQDSVAWYFAPKSYPAWVCLDVGEDYGVFTELATVFKMLADYTSELLKLMEVSESIEKH